MNAPATRAPFTVPAWLPAALALICLLFSVVTLVRWDDFRHAQVFGLWNLYDGYDLRVYFMSSGWAATGGTLYRDVPSEYPLLPNLLFAATRVVSNVATPLAQPGDRFAWAWVSTTLPLYCFMLYRLLVRYPKPAAFLWLTPSALHFSLFRYDVYVVIATLFALEALKDDRVRRAALLLGIVTALKGYSLFLLPALMVYVWQRQGFREAVTIAAICVAPFIAGNLIVLGFAGVDGLLFPYHFHAIRWLNGESTFDAIAYATGTPIREFLARVPKLPVLLQVACALIAATFRPRTFDQLMRAFLFATTAFVAFSVFYSPQFVLWLVPFVAEWSWPLVSWLVVATSWATFAYFPVAFFQHPRLFPVTVTVVAAMRLLLLVLTGIFRGPREAPAPLPAERASPALRGAS